VSRFRLAAEAARHDPEALVLLATPIISVMSC
jgi:hypothetical protein